MSDAFVVTAMRGSEMPKDLWIIDVRRGSRIGYHEVDVERAGAGRCAWSLESGWRLSMGFWHGTSVGIDEFASLYFRGPVGSRRQ